MADVVKNGVLVTPDSGSGNTQLTVKAQTPNLGNRVIKSATFNVTAPGVDEPATFVANLQPKPEFVTFDNGSEQSVDKSGGAVTITGKSNSSKLTFTKGSGEVITADISSVEYTAGGKSTVNGVAIEGDPGASAQYNFSITLTATENGTVEDRNQQIIVTAAGGSGITATITLKQSAGDAFISVDPEEISVPQDGTEVQVQVSTNTTFTVTAAS